MRRPWWLFYGVAVEAERHRYYTNAELIARAMARTAAQLDAFARQLGEALMPVCRQMTETITAMGRALAPLARHADVLSGDGSPTGVRAPR